MFLHELLSKRVDITYNLRTRCHDIILELIMKKCIPVLLYGLEVCDLPKRTIQSLDFSVKTVF